MKTYVNTFSTYDAAYDAMVAKNKPLRKAGNTADCFAVVPGPDSGYAVVDIDTAIDLGAGYVIGASSVSYTPNPWEK